MPTLAGKAHAHTGLELYQHRAIEGHAHWASEGYAHTGLVRATPMIAANSSLLPQLLEISVRERGHISRITDEQYSTLRSNVSVTHRPVSVLSLLCSFDSFIFSTSHRLHSPLALLLFLPSLLVPFPPQ